MGGKKAKKAFNKVSESASSIVKSAGKVGEKAVNQTAGALRDGVYRPIEGTFLGDLADMTTKTMSGGAFSASGEGGFLEQGNPLEGNTLFNSLLGAQGAVGEFIAEPMVEAKKAADVAAEQALDASQDERARLAKEAKDREAQEKALKEAGGSRSRRRMAQLRRQRTGLTGTRLGSTGSRALGAQQPGDSLLGT